MAGSLNIATDVIVLALPMPYLIRLEMTMYKKVTLMITFGKCCSPNMPGSLLTSPRSWSCVSCNQASIGQPIYPLQLANHKIISSVCIISAVKVALLPSVDTGDITFSIQHAMVLTVLEAALAVILACIPVLRPLFRSAISTMRTKSALGHYSTSARKSRQPKTGGFSVIEEQPLSPEATQPMPRRPEISYFSAEAVRASCSESKDGEELEMGGITVKTEFIARYSHISSL